MHSLEKRFQAHLSRFTEIKNKKLVIAVSGGLDSVVLLRLLHTFIGAPSIVVAHFDHRVRKTSRRDSLWVKALAKELGLKKIYLSQRKGASVSEEALRVERYRFLLQVRSREKAHFVVLAHHAEDQLETILMRLIRGTRIDGLGGMRVLDGFLWRPLLEFTKTELFKYAQAKQIQFVEDETNQDSRYFRNRVRKHLSPVLKELATDFGGHEKMLQRVVALTSQVQMLSDFSRKRAQQWIDKFVNQTECWWSFSKKEWEVLYECEQQAVAVALWDRLLGEPLETKEILQFQKAIHNDSHTVLSGAVHAICSFGVVFLLTSKHRTQIERIRSKGPWAFMESSQKRSHFRSQLKAKGLTLRFLKAGDQFEGKKMKRRCWEEKIPSVHRPLLPVLAEGNSGRLRWYYPQQGKLLSSLKAPWS